MHGDHTSEVHGDHAMPLFSYHGRNLKFLKQVSKLCIIFSHACMAANATVDRLTPSGYCDAVVGQLLLPVVEAVTHLPVGPQSMFVGLSVCILFNEFRKAVTANKKTYRSVK